MYINVIVRIVIVTTTFFSASVYAISEGVYLIRKTPDQLFSFNRRMCLLILGKDTEILRLTDYSLVNSIFIIWQWRTY